MQRAMKEYQQKELFSLYQSYISKNMVPKEKKMQLILLILN